MGTAKKVAVKKAAPVAAQAAKAVALALVSVKVNQAARIKGGKHDDLVGIVQAISEDGTRAKLLVQGLKENEPVDVLDWFDAEQLEASK